MKKVTIIGLDLAKNVFQLHGAAADGTMIASRDRGAHKRHANDSDCVVGPAGFEPATKAL